MSFPTREEFWAALDEERDRSSLNLHSLTNLLSIRDWTIPHGWAVEIVRGHDHLAAPTHLVEFISRLMPANASSLYDPLASLGTLIAGVAERVALSATADVANRDLAALLRRTSALVNWRDGWPMRDSETLPLSVDVIVSTPPLNFRPTRSASAPEAPSGHIDDLAESTLVACIRAVPEHGRAIFVLRERWWEERRGALLVRAIAEAGGAVEATITLPEGTFAPVTSIRTALIVVGRRTQGDVFVGELGIDPAHNDILLTNLTKRRRAKDVRLGDWLPLDGLRTVRSIAADRRLRQNARARGITPRRLGDIALKVSQSMGEAHQESHVENVIFVPRVGAVSGRCSGPNTRPEHIARHFFSIELDPNIADADYVVRYLGSPLGTLAFETVSSGNVPSLNRRTLLDLPVCLPDIVTQRGVLRAAAETRKLAQELHEIEERLWTSPEALDDTRARLSRVNREDRLEDWLDGLPFPLASILWRYKTLSSPKDRLETLLHFFEAYAEFWAIVLLSAYLAEPGSRTDNQKEVGRVMTRAGQSLERATFGTWLTLVEYFIARAGKQEENDYWQHALACGRGRAFEMLVGRDLVTVLRRANTYRNLWQGHSGVVDEATATTRLAMLEQGLFDLRNCVGERWEHYQLLLPGKMEYDGDSFLVDAEMVIGSRTPFQQTRVELTSAITTGQLYLVGEGTRASLRLLPFVRLMASPRTATNAFYFYNRKDKDGVRFVSYHFSQDGEVTASFEDTANAVNAIRSDGTG